MFEHRETKIGQWLLEQGENSDIVLSSRVRLARNLSELPFCQKASEQQQKGVISLVKSSMGKCRHLVAPEFYNFADLETIDRQFLMERYLISKELAQAKGNRAVIVVGDESISIMVNEEDHLRMQALRAGLQLAEAWEALSRVDDELDEQLDFAFSEQWGYLTACPTNTGTGLRASVMIHLAALIATKRVFNLLQVIAQHHLAIRGLHGEGSEMLGDFFQISNQVTLGQAEKDIITNTERLTKQLIVHEKRARDDLLAESRTQVEDRVERSVGILTHARIISSKETMEHLSSLRLGIYYGLVSDVPMSVVNELLIETQPAHLQKRLGKHLDTTARDIERASLIRGRLLSGEG